MFEASSVPIPATAPEDPRIGHLLGRKVQAGVRPRVALLGFPCDEGVWRNGGRRGAALAPDAIREAFVRLTPDAASFPAFADLLEQTNDLGNLVLSGDLEQDQQRLGEVVRALLVEGTLPLILGGGHETAYGHFLGYVNAGKDVDILNWDAHADVRELKEGMGHSGSPFRQALLHSSRRCRAYAVAGLQRHSNARSHLDFILCQGGNFVLRENLTTEVLEDLLASLRMPAMLSLDIDAVDQSAAPGVSAPTVGGIDPSFWLQLAYAAGRCDRVTSFELVEVNPLVDRDKDTVRLAAVTLWHFFRGFAERMQDRRVPRKS